MRTSLLLVCAVLLLAQDRAGAQDPWGNVKAWTGTATAEATIKVAYKMAPAK